MSVSMDADGGVTSVGDEMPVSTDADDGVTPVGGAVFSLGWVMAQLFDPRRLQPTERLLDPDSQLPQVAALDPADRRILAVDQLSGLLAMSALHLSDVEVSAAAGPAELKVAVGTLHKAILDRMAGHPEQLSAYQLGLALNDSGWVPSVAAGPDSLIQTFGVGQVAALTALLHQASGALPPLWAAVVARSLLHWQSWIEANQTRIRRKRENEWARPGQPMLDALRAQCTAWQSLLAGDTDPNTLLDLTDWVLVGSAPLRSTAQIALGLLRWLPPANADIAQASRIDALAWAVTWLPEQGNRRRARARPASRVPRLAAWALGMLAIVGAAVAVVTAVDGAALGLSGVGALLATEVSGGVGGLALASFAGLTLARQQPWAAATVDAANLPRSEEPAPGSAQPRLRYVNSVLWRSAGPAAVSVAAGDLLEPDADYRLGIGIGGPRRDSLLAATAVWPDETLSAAVGTHAWRLSVMVQGAATHDAQPAVKYLYLPPTGPAFVCARCDGLPADTDWDLVKHRECETEHRELAEFEVPRRASAGPVELDVLIYLGVALVHKHVVRLSVGSGSGASAMQTYTLTRTFGRLRELVNRSMSIDEGARDLTVNALDGRSGSAGAGVFAFRFTDANWNKLAVGVRTTLTTMHFREGKSGYEPIYPKVDVPADKYGGMLLDLAKQGRELFDGIFYTGASAELAPLLRHEAEARGQPPVVQIARTADRPFAVPWQVLYDLPMQYPEVNLWRCPSVDEYGPGGSGSSPPPATCPHSDQHERPGPLKAVLCPWGFWGLASILEVPEPPPDQRDLDHVISAANPPLAVLAAKGSGLDQTVMDGHLDRLKSGVEGFPPVPKGVLSRVVELFEKLQPPDMDIVYLISHAESFGSVLTFDLPVSSGQISAWTKDDWPADHWRGRRPLVVLNACHSAELTQSTLGSFVRNFVGSGAAGVIGTETLIDQLAASYAMEYFLAAFSHGASAGDAMRTMRWQMLRRGSLLGFCYTPYCAANLRARLPQEIP